LNRTAGFSFPMSALLPLRYAGTILVQGSRGFGSTASNVLDLKNTSVETTKSPKKMKPLKELVFGRDFADHMFEADWSREGGWQTPKISPYHPLVLDPSCTVFHYSAELFEGMKAYKDAKGSLRLFRPDKNADRFSSSAARLAMPTLESNSFVESIKQLVKLDANWVPGEKGYSLYIRPTLIGTQPSLGVGPSHKCKYFIICSPVGPYYPEGWKPVKLLASEKFVRAWPGGTGNSKIGGNYAPGIMPQVQAAEKGYTQILWLFGPDNHLTEVGTMNMFVFWMNEQGEKELITPALDGTILPGVTRDSILTLARQWNEFKVNERKVTMAEFLKALDAGRVMEAFGAGTAAVVSPIKVINFKGKDYAIPLDKSDPNASIGKLAARLADTILKIQYGEIEGPKGWSVKF